MGGDKEEDASMCVIVYSYTTLQCLGPLPLSSNACESHCLCYPGICASLELYSAFLGF